MKKIMSFLLLGLLCLSVSFALAENVAQSSAAAVQELEGLAELTPVSADMLVDGEYTIEVDSTSSMFKIDACTLTVANGEMTACMTMSGKGYLYVYMGTGAQAEAADPAEYIPFAEDAEGRHTYTVPVKALDCALDCAAFSKNKEKWYERQLVFKASSLPVEALGDAMQVTVASLGLVDGEYTVEALLGGGSGRTAIESPTKLRIADGQAFLTVIFSSPNYDYMVVADEKYPFLNEGGNSTFEIPLAAFDRALAVKADTVAMSEPHEIDYTITVISATLVNVE